MKEENTVTPKWILPPSLYSRFDEFIKLYNAVFKNPKKRRRPLLIDGAPGVGKSMFTLAFETLYRRDYPGKLTEGDVKRVNVSALAENIFESEIFGHKKGAFTGAASDKKGFLENTKVLILEEIGELSKPTQAKLLTFMEDGIYYRVGDTTPGKSADDIQIVATTNAPLTAQHFRQDFLDRCFAFHVPALHERRLDILYILAYQYPDCFSRLIPPEITAILAYNWPGNMRELEKFGITNTLPHMYKLCSDRSYCQHDFYDQRLAKKVIELFDLMNINAKRLEQFLNKAHLSLEFDELHWREERKNHPRKFTLQKFRPPLIPLKDFQNISCLQPGQVEWFSLASPIEQAFTHFQMLVILLNTSIDANFNLLDLDAVYQNPVIRYPNIEDYPLNLCDHASEQFDEDLENWFIQAYNYGKEYIKKNVVGEVLPVTTQQKTEADLLRAYYRELLLQTNGNVKEVARRSSINRNTLDSKLIKLGIHPTRKK